MRRILCGMAISGVLLCAAPVFAHSDHEAKEVRLPGDRNDRDVRDQERASGADASRTARDAQRQADRNDNRTSGGGSNDQANRSEGSNVSGSSSADGSGEVSVSTQTGDDHSGSGGSSGGSDGTSGSSGSSGSGGSGSDDSSGHGDDVVEQAGARQPVSVDLDRSGRERRASEVLVVGRSVDIQSARSHGYAVISQQRLEGSDGVIARLRVRGDETIERAVDDLHAAIPEARVSANYLFRPSGGASGAVAVGAARTSGPTHGVVGIVDTGVDPENARLRGAVRQVRGFAGTYTPREHGTGVAQVAVNAGVDVAVADVFEVDERGAPVASVDAIVRGLDWFIAQKIAVVNISITGPNNVVLADMVARARRHRMVIVAAAGNDGPGAAPAFPAALDGVVAVTAVDQSGHVYRRANRGDYIDFSAVGVRVAVSDSAGALRPVSGTSFAAPRVAAIVAKRLDGLQSSDGDLVVRQLAAEARDLGPRGRDPTFGWGELTSD